MALINDKKEAKKLAYKIVSDIAFYNQDKMIEGIINDNIFDLLEKEIDEGREIFFSRVAPDITDIELLYNHAVADVIMENGRNIRAKMWS